MRVKVVSQLACVTLITTSFMFSARLVAAQEHLKESEGVADSTIEEVFVTARKREERLLEVPVSMTAFEAGQLKSPMLNDISGLGALAPNVDFNWTAPLSGSSNAASVFIRGIGQNDFLLTTDPGVGIYLDGVYISRSVGGVLDLVDVERVEILRGPQGTLFGKNSIGGAIQVVSRRPSEETHFSSSLTGGDFNRRDVALSAEGALSESVQARFSMQTAQRDGYVTKLLGGKKLGDIDRRVAKLVLAYQATDHSEWRLSVDHTLQRQQAIAQSLLEVVDSPAGSLYNAFVADPSAPFDDRWVTGNPQTTYQTGPSQDDLEINGISLLVENDFTQATLTSISGYRSATAVYSRDPDGSPYAYAHGINWDDHAQFTQEFRLQGEADNLSWLVGIFYSWEHGVNRTDVNIYEGLYEALLLAGNPFAALFDTHFDVNNDQKTESGALFSQLTWALSDQLNVTVGARFTREKKTFSINNYSVLTGNQIQGPATVDNTWRNISPMLSVDYQWNKDVMTYMSVSKGFKSGGYNGRQIFPLPLDDFEPEFATTFELGVKSQLLHDYVNLTASVFHTEYKDMQFSALESFGGALLPVTNNAAASVIQGAELELSLNNKRGLHLNAGVGYLNAEYKSLTPETLAVTLSENAELVRVPRWNLSVDIGYRWVLGNVGSIGLTGSASYKSKVYNDPANVESIAQSGYTLLNGAVDWRSADQQWMVESFVTNMSDKRYLVTGATALDSTGFSEGHFGRPRELGVRLTYQY